MHLYIFDQQDNMEGIYVLVIKKSHSEKNCQELDQRAIGVWKYVRTEINAYLKNQIENYSKIDNSVK